MIALLARLLRRSAARRSPGPRKPHHCVVPPACFCVHTRLNTRAEMWAELCAACDPVRAEVGYVVQGVDEDGPYTHWGVMAMPAGAFVHQHQEARYAAFIDGPEITHWCRPDEVDATAHSLCGAA